MRVIEHTKLKLSELAHNHSPAQTVRHVKDTAKHSKAVLQNACGTGPISPLTQLNGSLDVHVSVRAQASTSRVRCNTTSGDIRSPPKHFTACKVYVSVALTTQHSTIVHFPDQVSRA